MPRLLLAAIVLALLAADAQAGRLRDRIAARRSTPSAQCSPQVAFPAASTSAPPASAQPAGTVIQGGNSCPGGNCPVQVQQTRGGFFRLK